MTQVKPFSTSFEQRPDVLKLTFKTGSIEFVRGSALFLAIPISFTVNDVFRFSLTDLVTLTIPEMGRYSKTVASTRLQLFQTQAVTKQ